MSNLQTLTDAFTELERRADITLRELPELDYEPTRTVRRPSRVLVPVGAAVAVVVAAAAPVIWERTHHTGSVAPAAPQQSSTSSLTPSPADTGSFVDPNATPAGNPPSHYKPPATAQALTQRALKILGPNVSLDVSQSEEGGQSGTGGPFISGTLTANGQSGGFDLQVFAGGIGDPAICEQATVCSVRPQPHGAQLALGHRTDPQQSGGITYQVLLVRADGAQIMIHLSTEQNPKRHSPVTASTLPLSVSQLIAFVSSPQW